LEIFSAPCRRGGCWIQLTSGLSLSRDVGGRYSRIKAFTTPCNDRFLIRFPRIPLPPAFAPGRTRFRISLDDRTRPSCSVRSGTVVAWRPLRPEANARCDLPPLLPWLTCLAPSVDVRWRPLVSVAVVTELVTHPPKGTLAVATGTGPNTIRHGPAWRCLMSCVPAQLDISPCSARVYRM
jgi:hypothetical protein